MKIKQEQKIEAHTKVSMNAYDKGLEQGKAQALASQNEKVQKLKEEIKKKDFHFPFTKNPRLDDEFNLEIKEFLLDNILKIFNSQEQEKLK